MKTIEDIKFEDHQYFSGGVKGVIFFENGYGVSVINGIGSYARNTEEYELAVIYGNENRFYLCYDTPITDDVIGYLSPEEVNEIMVKVQNLPSRES